MSGKAASQLEWLNAIGSVTHSAGVAELILMNTLRAITGFDVVKAKALYFAADAQPTRYKILKALSGQLPAAQAAHVETIIGAAERIFSKRNELAHSFLIYEDRETGIARGDDDELFQRIHLRHPKQPQKPVTVEYLETMTKPADVDERLAYNTFKALCGELQVPPKLVIE